MITASVAAKGSNLLVEWRGRLINFGFVRMAEDGSFYFTSGFHDGSYSSTIDFGTSNFKEGRFLVGPTTNTEPSAKDTHFSLHPQSQVMLLRRGHKGATLFERKIKWFPVTKPFHLLRLYSPPLTDCLPSQKVAGLRMPVPDEHEDSLELIIDIFPRGTKVHNPHTQSLWINFGFSPYYMARVTLNYSNQKTPALLFWPEDDLLEL